MACGVRPSLFTTPFFLVVGQTNRLRETVGTSPSSGEMGGQDFELCLARPAVTPARCHAVYKALQR